MRPLMMLFLVLGLALVPLSAKTKEEKVDFLSLAALLMRDGYYDRAEQALSEVDTNDTKVDMARFYTLHGLLSTKLSRFEESITYFYKAIAQGQEDKTLYIYIAQSHFSLKEYAKAIEALDTAGEIAKTKAGLFGLKAQCYFELEQAQNAIDVLREGMARFDEDSTLYRQTFFYLAHWGLFQEAMPYAQGYIAREKNAKAYIAIASLLKKAKQRALAIGLMEEAKLAYPKDADAMVMLAHLYIDEGKLHAAADLFDQASIYESKYIKEAGELYRRAKALYRALYFNAQILDQKEKLQQRLAILLEFGDYEIAAAMEQSLGRVGLIENEDIRYALAFTLFQTGEYGACESHLAQLTRSDLFRKAIELRKSIQKCQETPWECE